MPTIAISPTVARPRDAIAASLAAKVKAYALAQVSVELGLGSGTSEEAFSSKYKYVEKRLPAEREFVLKIAEEVLQRFPQYHLEEAVWLAYDDRDRQTSEVTRKNILEALAKLGGVEGKLGILEFLKRIWPLVRITASGATLEETLSDPFLAMPERTLEDKIHRHMVRNEDWDYPYLFERLGVMESSERRFLRFLEEVVHPLVREPSRQQVYANAMNEHLRRDGLELRAVQEVSGYPVYQVLALQGGVRGRPKNLIFAANGPKPEIVLREAVNNDVEIVKNAQYCLDYDRPIPSTGLRWGNLLDWWADLKGLDGSDKATANALYQRLKAALASPPEGIFFRAYYRVFGQRLQKNLPVLIPQVYLHYDPYTARQFGGSCHLQRQRMDFLMLLSSFERLVFEVDGKHHYAEGESASPKRYAMMAAADRQLRLAGYEVYRFGAVELADGSGERVVEDFFMDLFTKHKVLSC